MTTTAVEKGYRPTESKYKSGAHEMYVTYDLEQKTRSERNATYPKVKRVYVSSNVTDYPCGIAGEVPAGIAAGRVGGGCGPHPRAGTLPSDPAVPAPTNTFG